jgi:SAM-dependent methyltransferase
MRLVSDNNIFLFEDGKREDPAPQEERLLDRAREIGWKAALDSVFDDKLFIKYITSDERLAVLDVLPLEEGQNVLEIGPGYGQMTGAIARRAATVDVIEADTTQARFCRIRFDQDGMENIRIVAGASEGDLPYADGAFDGVVMNLVFEWCALRSTLPHKTVQSAYLAEIARVLRPGGFLFLSTKNRFALRLLTGGRDEHMAKMRFGSALPRAVGRALMGGARPHGYLHSFRAQHSLIENAGFRVDTPNWAVPDIRWPTR